MVCHQQWQYRPNHIGGPRWNRSSWGDPVFEQRHVAFASTDDLSKATHADRQSSNSEWSHWLPNYHCDIWWFRKYRYRRWSVDIRSRVLEVTNSAYNFTKCRRLLTGYLQFACHHTTSQINHHDVWWFKIISVLCGHWWLDSVVINNIKRFAHTAREDQYGAHLVSRRTKSNQTCNFVSVLLGSTTLFTEREAVRAESVDASHYFTRCSLQSVYQIEHTR